MADRTPNWRAGYEHEDTTPRSPGRPPTANARPRRSGRRFSSTAQKKASRSRCRMVVATLNPRPRSRKRSFLVLRNCQGNAIFAPAHSQYNVRDQVRRSMAFRWSCDVAILPRVGFPFAPPVRGAAAHPKVSLGRPPENVPGRNPAWQNQTLICGTFGMSGRRR